MSQFTTRPPAVAVVLDGDSAVECDRRPFPAVVAGAPADHAPALDITLRGSRVRLALAEDMTADQAWALRVRLAEESAAWLREVDQWVADLEAREASAGGAA